MQIPVQPMSSPNCGLSHICFLQCRSAPSILVWHLRSERRGLVDGAVLFIWDFPDWFTVIGCGWENCHKRLLCERVNPDIQGSLKKRCAKLLKALAPAFTACFYLQFTGCLSAKEFSQRFLWAGAGSPPFWWDDFFRRRKPFLNLILSSQVLCITDRRGSVPPSLPSPWARVRKGRGSNRARKSPDVTYTCVCVPAHTNINLKLVCFGMPGDTWAWNKEVAQYHKGRSTERCNASASGWLGVT